MNHTMANFPVINTTCCRLCLSESVNKLQSIVNGSIDDADLREAILLFVGVRIMAEDKLSTMVCVQCIKKVNTWRSFKLACCENQTKLEQLFSLNNGDISDVNIQIKEEPIDHDVLIPEVVTNGEVSVKNEQMEEGCSELPPPLTPQAAENEDVEVVTLSPYSQLTSNDEDGNNTQTQNHTSTMISSNSKASNIVMMCERCDRMFTSQEQLKEHKLSHENMPILDLVDLADDENRSRRFCCKICDNHYASYSGLCRHNRKKHPKNKLSSDNFLKKCEHCEKILTGGSYYKHKQMHERNNKTHKKHKDPPKLQVSTGEETNKDDTESYPTCKRCFKHFSTSSNLKKHMKSHGEPQVKTTKKTGKKVWCNVCHCAFDSTASLAKHKTQGHSHQDDDAMPMLSDEASEVDLKKHKETHSRAVRLATKNKQHLVYCKYCKISFANPFQLTKHMGQEHEEAKQTSKKEKTSTNFSCKLCGKNFVTALGLRSHEGWHKRGKHEPVGRNNNENANSRERKCKSAAPVEKKQKPEPVKVTIKQKPDQHQCSTCKAVLPDNAALQIHILEKHRNVNATILPARCAMCNLNFSSQEEYDQHKRFHAMIEKQPNTKTCSYTQGPAGFSKMKMLKTRVRQFHKEVQEHRCHHCDRVFEKANSLSIHLKVHEKQRLVTGNSSSPKPLSRAKSSAGSKPLYSCSICKQGFNLPKDLRTHTIQAHPF